MREKEQSSQERNSIWKQVTVSRCERGRMIKEAFSSDDLSFFVAEWSRWDKYKRAPRRQDPSAASARDGWWQASLGQPQEHMIVG